MRGDRAHLLDSLAGARPRSFWLDTPDRPAALPALQDDLDTDLLVVGGGYCGLWTALQAKEQDPDRDVVLLEGRTTGWAASGRNGGFLEASLTHGPDNGQRHFPTELDVLERLAQRNFDALTATLDRYGIDAELEDAGELVVATTAEQERALRAAAGPHARFLDSRALTAYVDSPLLRAGLLQTRGVALVNPAKLVWGLRRACLRLGVRIFEHTSVTGLADPGTHVVAHTGEGVVRARRVAVATNGFPSLLRRTRSLTLPVYDYVLMTEPLTPDQLAAVGWTGRHGITDCSRQFHYYRKTADDRVLWGGYDVVYHRGGGVDPAHDRSEETFLRLADHFFATFPRLAGTRFTHAWGGMIDMSSRLVAHHGVAMGGKVAHSAGFTGLGLAATRFAGTVMLDLLAGRDTELTRLSVVTRRPLPIPPEPLRFPAVQVMRRAIARSDRNGGRDGLLIKVADRIGFSFDS
ncbi:NAD(P)/FAD-dependent oxidoreductase [Kineococcus sp. SYSU DK001]|uniref:NAD(P)/FAD-dependent oxidoreductase n=1 Tax=Kineococcus sp. SYSU DK001 TaxID=3383122 RepID=UPI003D7D0DC2